MEFIHYIKKKLKYNSDSILKKKNIYESYKCIFTFILFNLKYKLPNSFFNGNCTFKI